MSDLFQQNPLTFFVPGIPAPGGSKTGFYNPKAGGWKQNKDGSFSRKGKVLMAPASKKTKPWMQAVSGTVRAEYDGEPLPGPLRCDMQFRMMRPKGHYGSGKNAGVIKSRFTNAFPTGRPDRVKLIRSTEDALTGILWKDDSQVVAGIESKIYVERDPGVVITVSTVQNVEVKRIS